jgi:hypothetical protein
VFKSNFAFTNYTRAGVDHTNRVNITQSVILTRMSVMITFVSVIITLRVEITLMRVEITVVSVVITFVRVKTTLRTEITLYVYELHSSLLKSHFLFRNYTRACVHACETSQLM